MLVERSGKPSKRSKKGHSSITPRELAIKTMPRVIPLAFKLGLVYLSFKRKAKKAGKIFEKELLANGIDKDTAKLLKEDYLLTSHFLSGLNLSYMARERYKEKKYY